MDEELKPKEDKHGKTEGRYWKSKAREDFSLKEMRVDRIALWLGSLVFCCGVGDVNSIWVFPLES